MPKKGRKSTRMTPGFTGPFKGEPQPGTLFDKRALDQLPGNIEATRNRPGPRGYSPARLGEVRRSFDTAWPRGNDLTPVTVTGAGRANETAHQFGPSSYDPDNPRFGRARSRILDTLSRSTINVSDEMEDPLAGLGQIRYERHMPNVAGQYKAVGNYGEPDATGFRRDLGPTVLLYGDEHRGSHAALWGKDERAEQTLLHEIGHHDSRLRMTEHSEYETKRQQAQEEAYADRFAVTHFRRDPRNKGPYDPRENTYMGRGGLSRFEGAQDEYRRALPKSMYPANRNVNGRQFYQPELDETQPLGRLAQREHSSGLKGAWPDVFIGRGIEDSKKRIR